VVGSLQQGVALFGEFADGPVFAGFGGMDTAAGHGLFGVLDDFFDFVKAGQALGDQLFNGVVFPEAQPLADDVDGRGVSQVALGVAGSGGDPEPVAGVDLKFEDDFVLGLFAGLGVGLFALGGLD